MTVFAVLPATENRQLEERIKELFPDNHFKLSDNQWLVSAKMTSRELTEKLRITSPDQGIPSTAVFSLSGFFGKHSPELWEWLIAKMEN